MSDSTIEYYKHALSEARAETADARGERDAYMASYDGACKERDAVTKERDEARRLLQAVIECFGEIDPINCDPPIEAALKFLASPAPQEQCEPSEAEVEAGAEAMYDASNKISVWEDCPFKENIRGLARAALIAAARARTDE